MRRHNHPATCGRVRQPFDSKNATVVPVYSASDEAVERDAGLTADFRKTSATREVKRRSAI